MIDSVYFSIVVGVEPVLGGWRPPTGSFFAGQGMDLALPSLAPTRTPFLLLQDIDIQASSV